MTPIATNLHEPTEIALDKTGNVFISERNDGRVRELPRKGDGYGSGKNLPFGLLHDPNGVAVDGAGNVYVSDYGNDRVVELPKTALGYGLQQTLPTIDVAFVGQLAADDDGTVFLIDLQYRSPSPRLIEIRTHSAEFDQQYVCERSTMISPLCSQTLPLTFRINAGVTLDTPTVLTNGKPDLDFTVGSGNTCVGALIEGSTCTVNVTFSPTAKGMRSGSIELVGSGGTVLATVPLAGFGVAAPDGAPTAQISDNYLRFGTVLLSQTATLPLTITNVGGGTLTVGSQIAAPSYRVTASTCGSGLSYGQSCTLQVLFSPATLGVHNYLWTLSTNSSVAATTKLDSDAIGVIAVPKVLNFGSVARGSKATLPLEVINDGVSGTVAFSSLVFGPSYRVSTTMPNTCKSGLATGSTCTFSVDYVPVSAGSHNGRLTLTPGDGVSAYKIELKGETN